jgi:hypothetical protein
MIILPVPFSTQAASDMAELLPADSCGSGWQIEGRPLFYDRETLSERINGEAELYLPYGFDRMAAARYAAANKADTGMDVEIYRMGSPLDAFGIFANYRQKEGSSLPFGAESNLSGSQLFLYQGRYFVHIQTTGSVTAGPDSLVRCAQTVAFRLPGTTGRPPELSVLDRLETVKGSERYLPQGLLGYDFLNRGIMAEAVVEGTNTQIFLLLDTTTESASAAFGSYRSQLALGKSESGEDRPAFLEGLDSIYGPVIVLKKGNCLAGALKFGAKKGIRAILEKLCR